MTRIREKRLENGLQISFVDESNRYFGDYHRICVVVTMLFNLQDLPADNAEAEIFRSKAIADLGEEVKVVKRFERMGVPTADVEVVRNAMVEDFLESASSYLNRPEYPRLLADAEMKKRRTYTFYG